MAKATVNTSHSWWYLTLAWYFCCSC